MRVCVSFVSATRRDRLFAVVQNGRFAWPRRCGGVSVLREDWGSIADERALVLGVGAWGQRTYTRHA